MDQEKVLFLVDWAFIRTYSGELIINLIFDFLVSNSGCQKY